MWLNEVKKFCRLPLRTNLFSKAFHEKDFLKFIRVYYREYSEVLREFVAELPVKSCFAKKMENFNFNALE